jgi:hypothetical protein
MQPTITSKPRAFATLAMFSGVSKDKVNTVITLWGGHGNWANSQALIPNSLASNSNRAKSIALRALPGGSACKSC